MKRLLFRPIGLLLLAISLAGCTASAQPHFKDAFDKKTFEATSSNGARSRVTFERFATMVEFPDGETAGMLFVREVDSETGQPLKGGPGEWYAHYAFDGETMERMVVRGVTQSIIPALTSGAASIKVAKINSSGDSTGTLIYNSVGASIESDVDVEIEN